MKVDAAGVRVNKLTTSQATKLGLLGLGLGLLPHALGLLLGFGAFVATPLLGTVVAFGCGVIVTRTAERTPWCGMLLLCLVAGCTFAGLLSGTMGILAVRNQAPQQLLGVLIAAAWSLVPIAAGSVVVSFGVLFGLRLQRHARAARS